MAKKEVIQDRSKKVELGLDTLMSDRFGRYSKYIIQERALPDGRDGLKPVQRRILYAMWEDGNTFDKPTRKSAKAVGYIIGYYHPHGDSSVYDAIVRMSQDFKMNIPLIDMQGNNGSIDNDPAAAMRYTESRLAKIAKELLADIDKECVNFTNNYDDTMVEPTVLPLRFPLLLVNGSTGIASGYATNIAPHNLNEVIDATIYRLHHPGSSVEELMEYIKGPDFPTGGIVQGIDSIKEVFKTGRGKVVLRSRCTINETRSIKQIIVTEIPYEVVKIDLVKKIDEIKINGDIDGILEVRDESGKDGLRIVIDIKKEQDPELILNYLYKNTDLQVNYNYNMIAIIDHRPVLMDLTKALDAFIAFRKETVLRRTKYLLDKKSARLHIIEGLIKAISILDDVIEIIRRSNDKADAKRRLMEAYLFTEAQAEAIVNLRLYRLSNTDITILKQEYATITKEILELRSIIDSDTVLINLIATDLKEIKDNYPMPRKTTIERDIEDINIDKEAMIINEPCVISVSKTGYIKRMSLRSYNANPDQLPGFKEGDELVGYKEVEMLDTLLLFTDKGNYAYIPVYTIDETRFKDIGKHFTSIVRSEVEEKIVKAMIVKNFASYVYVTMVSKDGMIKKTPIKDFKVQRYSKVMKAMSLADDDQVVDVTMTLAHDDIIVLSKAGYYNRYSSDVISDSSPRSKGIKAIGLRDDEVVSVISISDDSDDLLVITESGQMKRIHTSELELTSRATKGSRVAKLMRSKQIYDKKAMLVRSFDELIIYDGERKKLPVSNIPIMAKEATYSSPLDLNEGFFVLLSKDTGIIELPIIDMPSDIQEHKVEEIGLFER